MTRIGVIGSGEVGQTLAQGFKKHGFEVRIATRTAGKLAEFSKESGIAVGSFADVAAWAEGLVLAVKGSTAADAMRQAGAANVAGKVVMDTTNPIADLPPEDGVLRFFTSLDRSLMEDLQQEFPTTKFVKAFSTVGNSLMVDPVFPGGGSSTLFICGNDAAARAEVTGIITTFGHQVADMGTAKAARAIEPLCMLWCIPGFLRNEWDHAFALLKA